MGGIPKAVEHIRAHQGVSPMTTKAQIIRAIRSKCIDCCGGSKREVALCNATACDLWSFRMGRDPAPRDGVGFAKHTPSRPISCCAASHK